MFHYVIINVCCRWALAGSGKMKGGGVGGSEHYNSTLDHGKIRFKVVFSCLPRAAGSQLVPVGTLFYPCKTGENLYSKYGPASVGDRAPCSLC